VTRRPPHRQGESDREAEGGTTHFGYQQVPWNEKARRVAGVFDSVADRYDVMNDVMSLGIHRLWKRFTIEMSGVRRGQRVLDLAGGTGDLAARFSRMVGPDGEVVLGDINASMLQRGRERLTDRGVAGNLQYVQVNAEALPFPDDHFDCITIAFGLRNVTDKDAALASMYRVLRPGGRLLVLEFSHPRAPGLKPLYDLYSFKMLPLMGRFIARDEASYRYLAESIRMHPDQETLKQMMEQAGFERCEYFNLTGGIVALHRGYKF
jgi:demethylmenaquinone methyltransferase / 2-methoxy-6-polyprenyl-1,4-benzoquinol methylase